MEIDIIIHLPSTDTGRTQLENKVSEIHADCIEKYMNNMGYSEKEKRNLIEQILCKFRSISLILQSQIMTILGVCEYP